MSIIKRFYGLIASWKSIYPWDQILVQTIPLDYMCSWRNSSELFNDIMKLFHWNIGVYQNHFVLHVSYHWTSAIPLPYQPTKFIQYRIKGTYTLVIKGTYTPSCHSSCLIVTIFGVLIDLERPAYVSICYCIYWVSVQFVYL